MALHHIPHTSYTKEIAQMALYRLCKLYKLCKHARCCWIVLRAAVLNTTWLTFNGGLGHSRNLSEICFDIKLEHIQGYFGLPPFLRVIPLPCMALKQGVIKTHFWSSTVWLASLTFLLDCNSGFKSNSEEAPDKGWRQIIYNFLRTPTFSLQFKFKRVSKALIRKRGAARCA